MSCSIVFSFFIIFIFLFATATSLTGSKASSSHKLSGLISLHHSTKHIPHRSSWLHRTGCIVASQSTPDDVQVEVSKVQLSSGTLAEVMICRPSSMRTSQSVSPFGLLDLRPLFTATSTKGGKAPLVFIHGSFHASWCWTEHYFSFFTKLGHPCFALSLRGTGGTFAGEGVKRVKIMEHVDDVEAFLNFVQETTGGQNELKPVVIAHSFGGLAIMKYLESNLLMKSNDCSKDKTELAVSGVVMLCSVPPSGNGKMTLRFLRRSLKDSWKITAGLALKKCITNEHLCRILFFGGEKKLASKANGVTGEIDVYDDFGVSDEDLIRYQRYFERDTVATIDLTDLAKKLPSRHIDSNGRAVFFEGIPQALVIGANNDFIVDKEGVEETARYFGVNPVMVDSSHDVMLGRKWYNCAKTIKTWLEDQRY